MHYDREGAMQDRGRAPAEPSRRSSRPIQNVMMALGSVDFTEAVLLCRRDDAQLRKHAAPMIGASTGCADIALAISDCRGQSRFSIERLIGVHAVKYRICTHLTKGVGH